MAAAAAAAAAAAEPVEEKTEFDVIIKDAGPKKIEVIKVIRQLTSLGLKEAKDVAETAGSKVLEAVSKEAATDAKGQARSCWRCCRSQVVSYLYRLSPNSQKVTHWWPFFFSNPVVY